ncbi:MAG: hypothetical protein GKC10_02915 [Methanosarcinales archaeon]|nr:hypothetical protein [Methanosarcinales archaeon]
MGRTIGTEHEYSINDSQFNPLPISDCIIQEVSGNIADEVPFGDLLLSKELQKHAIELIPQRPALSLKALEASLQSGVDRLHRIFGERYRFMGLGMHPLLTLDQTTYWDHDEGEYYRAYHRLFNIWQHGWLNIQALQINFPYRDQEEMLFLFNRVRALMPYLVAVSAASPFVEGRATSRMDNRLVYYRENQRQIPLICNDILPERIKSPRDYVEINRRIYRDLKEQDAGILCREWVNSRGVIVRFTRCCLEVKAIDEQECLHSDMAMTAFLLSLLRCGDLDLEEDESALRDLLERAIETGTRDLKPELEGLFGRAWDAAGPEERSYLPLVRERIERGSLAEVLAERCRQAGEIRAVLPEVADSLRFNRPLL